MIKTKLIFILFYLILTVLESKCQAPNAVTQIEYTTLTRGYQKHIIISPDSVTTQVEGRQEDQLRKRSLSKDEWRMLTQSLKDVKLSEVSEFKSPTAKRTYDGAYHSTLILTTKDKTEHVHSFDNEDTHEKLLPLMKAVLKVSEKVVDTP